MSPGIKNLFEILKAGEATEAHEALMNSYKSGALKYSEMKGAVADCLVELRNEFVTKKEEITADKKAVKSQIKQSSHEIRLRAQQTLKEVKELCGLSNVRF